MQVVPTRSAQPASEEETVMGSELQDVTIDRGQLTLQFNHDMQVLFSDPSRHRMVMWIIRGGVVNEAFEFTDQHLAALRDHIGVSSPT